MASGAGGATISIASRETGADFPLRETVPRHADCRDSMNSYAGSASSGTTAGPAHVHLELVEEVRVVRFLDVMMVPEAGLPHLIRIAMASEPPSARRIDGLSCSVRFKGARMIAQQRDRVALNVYATTLPSDREEKQCHRPHVFPQATLQFTLLPVAQLLANPL